MIAYAVNGIFNVLTEDNLVLLVRRAHMWFDLFIRYLRMFCILMEKRSIDRY